jgi:hypothetical protein
MVNELSVPVIKAGRLDSALGVRRKSSRGALPAADSDSGSDSYVPTSRRRAALGLRKCRPATSLEHTSV